MITESHGMSKQSLLLFVAQKRSAREGGEETVVCHEAKGHGIGICQT
jgi:hypothetical protein